MAGKRTTDRVRRMELYFDTIGYTLKNYPDMLKRDKYIIRMLKAHTDYYENGLWQKDYELDEKGGFPADLKRGVLSQDGVYNLLQEIKKTIG